LPVLGSGARADSIRGQRCSQDCLFYGYRRWSNMSNGYQITEKKRDTLVCPRWECMGAQELLDVWLLPLVQEVGGILEEAYCTSHQLLPRGGQGEERTLGLLQHLPRGGQGEERILGQLQHALMTAITELQVVKGWRASCSNMSSSSSDKECRVLKGEEEDTSEGKVLKEGSEAGQSANQQADCGKQKICRCESCDVCYYQWRLRHE